MVEVVTFSFALSIVVLSIEISKLHLNHDFTCRFISLHSGYLIISDMVPESK